MPTRSILLSVAVTVVGVSDGQAPIGPPPGNSHLVSARAIGSIALGMSLDEIRRNLPAATLQRTSDADGAALVEVMFRGGESLILWASEEDPDVPIDWAKPIRTIETFDPSFSTRDGIRVGTPLAVAERVWGAVREIVESEIESRQFVTFERRPATLSIRIDYSEVFPPGARRTTRYRPDAKIMSLAISSE